jgi:hypothetical protein
VLVEASTGQVLATHRGELRRPVASTIKILTALTVLDRAEPDELVVVGEEARDIEGASVGLTRATSGPSSSSSTPSSSDPATTPPRRWPPTSPETPRTSPS